MSEYQLTNTPTVIRIADGVHIPDDPANRDRIEYELWLDDGGVPDSYVPPLAVPPTPTSIQTILFDHENRLRSQEGLPLLTFKEFIAGAKLDGL